MAFTIVLFLFTGCYYLCVADNKHLNISKSSVCRCVERVTRVICAQKHKFIKFPESEQAQKLAHEDFYAYCGIPTVLGAIDGMQIKIKKPICVDWYQFLNRKSITAINVSVSVLFYFLGVNYSMRFFEFTLILSNLLFSIQFDCFRW